jgi:DNA-binding NtrC family response regulator
MQAKLLRALQERAFFRLGSERITHSDFRVISASNRDLLAGTAAGTFREDLFYRLAVIHIALPPLRDRPDDIRWLTERMLQEIAAEQGRPIAVSETFLRDILGRRWNGNARELRSYLEQATVLSEGGVLDVVQPAAVPNDGAPGAELPMVPLSEAVEEAERAHIRRAIAFCGGSVGKTSEMLGISRKTLWEKMRKLDIRTDDPS